MGNDLQRGAPCGDLPKGLPVLVYPTDSPASHCLCNLTLDYSKDHMQLTLYLQFSVFIDGFDSEQIFIFQYEADNFKPGTISISSCDPEGIDPTKVNRIVRQTKHKIHSLSLTLKEACPIWCPVSLEVIAPKEHYAESFYELAALGQATNIHILFDQNELREKRRACLEHLIEYPENFTGFGISRRCFKNYSCKDWRVFGTDNGPPSEAPPPYTCAYENVATVARRPASEPPASKNELSIPAPASEPSTTEKATTALPQSPESPSSPSVNLPDFDLNAFDFQNIVRNAVSAVFPECLMAIPSLPTTLEPLFNDLLDKFFNNALYRAQDELIDVAEVHRLDINQAREDSCLEANDMFHKMLDMLESSMATRLESFKERAGDVSDEVFKRLDGMDSMKGLSKLMRSEQEWMRKLKKSRRERKKLKKERKRLREERIRTKGEMKRLKWEFRTEMKRFAKERKHLKMERKRSKELDKQEVGLELRHIRIKSRGKLDTSLVGDGT